MGIRTTRRDHLLTALPAAGAGAAALACRPADQGAPAPEGQPATLSLMYGHRDPDWSVIWGPLQRDLPNVTLKLAAVTGPYRENMVVELASGNVWDIMYVHHVNAGEFITSGAFAPLDAHIGRDRQFDLKDFPDGLLEPYRTQGKQYGLPIEVGPWITWYNRDLFERAGVTTPEQHWKANTWTVKQFLDTAKALTRPDGERSIWGYAGNGTGAGFWGFTYWLPFVQANGGDLFSKDQTKFTLDDPRAVEMLQVWADLSNTHRVAPPFGSPEWSDQALAPGRVAMGMVAPFVIPRFKAYGWPVALAPNPAGPAGRYAMAGSSMFGIGGTSTQKDAAWPVVRWLATRGVQNWLDEGYYTAPTRKSMLSYEGWKRSRQPWESLDAWAEGIRNVRLPFSVPKFAEIMNTWAAAWEPALKGQATAKEVVTRVKPAIDNLLAQGRPR